MAMLLRRPWDLVSLVVCFVALLGLFMYLSCRSDSSAAKVALPPAHAPVAAPAAIAEAEVMREVRMPRKSPHADVVAPEAEISAAPIEGDVSPMDVSALSAAPFEALPSETVAEPQAPMSELLAPASDEVQGFDAMDRSLFAPVA